MNKNNTEVELKYQIRNQKKLQGWLDKNAKLIFSSRQVDEYYTPAHENYFKEKRPRKYLRIRKSGDRWSTAFKYWYPSGKKGEYSHCDEFETDVDNGIQLRKIYLAVGFKLLVIVDKTRTAYRYREFEIEIDKVRGLGGVCEIEIKGKYRSPEEALKRIKEFAQGIGFIETDRGDDLKLGYAYLIAKRKGIVKK